MQTNGWLVQDIQYPHQRRSNLRCQPDALALAAGERPRSAGQGQVTQPHVQQKLQPGGYLLDNLRCNQRHIPFQMQGFHEIQFLADAHGAEVHNAHASDSHRLCNGRQPLAVAHRTGGRGHTFFQFLPSSIRLRFPIAPGDVIEDSLKGLLQYAHAISTVIGHVELFSLCTIQDNVHHIPGQLLHRYGQREMVLLCQRLKVHSENGIGAGALPAGGLNGTVKDGFLFIWNHQVFVRNQLKAQPGAAGAGTGGIVEGEHPWLQFRHTDAAVLAGIILGEGQFFLLPRNGNGHQSPGMVAGRLDGVGQTAANAVFQNKAVNNQLNGMLFILLRLDFFGEIILDAIQAQANKALLAGILKHLLVLTFFAPHHRGENQELSSIPQCLYPIHNLVNGLAANFLAALWAMGNAGSCP